MKENIIVGPILGIEENNLYTISIATKKTAKKVEILIDNKLISAKFIQNTPSVAFYKAYYKVDITNNNKYVSYEILVDSTNATNKNNKSLWTFYIPAKDEKPKIAYTSCNGFSQESLKITTKEPYYLWDKISKEHMQNPYSLLIMGGDQVYADSIWEERGTQLSIWSNLPRDKKIKKKVSSKMENEIDKFYDNLYKTRWSDPNMSLMFASIPSVMMWDDHDIFDGWGSYPDDIQNCDVYKSIFKYAKKYFQLYQIRSSNNKTLINKNLSHYSFLFEFRNYNILALDNRINRTINQVMNKEQWDDINNIFNSLNTNNDLLVLSAVPVAYRDFSFTEGMFDYTPWEEELSDDLKDHWRAKSHQGERARLIMNLLDKVENNDSLTVILSGDVHIGCLGVINDTRDINKTKKIHQIVSSGIVHPPPSMIAWNGIMAVTNDNDEFLNEDHTIKISMLTPHASNKYIRSRNFVSLQEDEEKVLWVNWKCEHNDNPVYPLKR